MDKAELLHKMDTSFAELEALLSSLSEDELLEPGVYDSLSVKDIVAHMAAWARLGANAIATAARGEAPTWFAPGSDLDVSAPDDEVMRAVHRLNADILKRERDRPLQEVLSELREAHLALRGAAEAVTETDLFDPDRFPWRQGQPLWTLVGGNSFWHYREHVELIEAWQRRERGESPRRVFMVDGKPFFSVGGQARNSSGYSPEEAETAFRALDLIGGNTLEIPVYWELVEPEEGRFHWSGVDALLELARRHGVKLVLLWFATWKNGDMDYAPAWVKQDPARFRRVVSAAGRPIWVLSSHCQANWEADKAAFTALCAHLKERDAAERTVIALQIENEPGILGSDRDYGPEAQAEFEALVPEELIARLKTAGHGRVYDLWKRQGGQEGCSWHKAFGWSAGEVLTTYSIARYIDGLAEAGKAIHDIPMYVNVWLGEGSWAIAGETYPSGGAVAKVLDIYKWFAPHIDLIAPDIYIQDAKGYEAMCAAYARDDNPLFIPESGPVGSNAWNMFKAVAKHDAIGYHFFAIEQIMAADGTVLTKSQAVVDSIRCLAAAAPLLLKHQGAGRIHAVAQEENQIEARLDLDGYVGLIEFGQGPGRHPTDWRHYVADPTPGDDTSRGRGLVFQAGRHEFYLVGAGYRLYLRPKLPPQEMLDASLANDRLRNSLAQFVALEEGHFEGRTFVVDRVRNGDEANHGIWVEPDVGVVRAVLCE